MKEYLRTKSGIRGGFSREDIITLKTIDDCRPVLNYASWFRVSKGRHAWGPRKLPDFCCYLFVEGGGRCVCDGHEYKLGKGDLVYITAGTEHLVETSIKEQTLIGIVFFDYIDGRYFRVLDDAGGKRCYQLGFDFPARISGKMFSAAVTLFKGMAEECFLPRDGSALLKRSLLSELLVAIHRSCPAISASAPDHIVKVEQYLRLNLGRIIDREDLCRVAGLKNAQLTRLFTENFGASPIHYLNNLRLGRAKELLTFSDLPVAEIALQCGMADPHYFSRAYRKKFGISPRGYRQSLSLI